MKKVKILAAVFVAGVACSTLAIGGKWPPKSVKVKNISVSAETALNGEWRGEFQQYDPGTYMKYPMILTDIKVTGQKFTAVLNWPTFDNTTTEVQGTLEKNALLWTETRYITKGTELKLDGDYKASFKDKSTIEGIVTLQNFPTKFGKFVLKKVK